MSQYLNDFLLPFIPPTNRPYITSQISMHQIFNNIAKDVQNLVTGALQVHVLIVGDQGTEHLIARTNENTKVSQDI